MKCLVELSKELRLYWEDNREYKNVRTYIMGDIRIYWNIRI